MSFEFHLSEFRLNNIGMTCYINAVLQSMFALNFSKELVNELKSYGLGECKEEQMAKVSNIAPFTLYVSCPTYSLF